MSLPLQALLSDYHFLTMAIYRHIPKTETACQVSTRWIDVCCHWLVRFEFGRMAG